MRWFGGHTGGLTVVPAEARILWKGPLPVWLVGDWPDDHVRVAHGQGRAVAVLGPCGASHREVQALLIETPTEPSVTWPGCYTIVLVRTDTLANTVSVWTDVGGACPIYSMSHDGGTVWGSSSRALAALTGTQIDNDWLATHLAAPAATPMPGWSAFAGISLVEGGHRLTLQTGREPQVTTAWGPRRSSWSEAVRGLRTALEGGVTARVATARAVTADCSGGLDSTSLCLLAGRHAPITAITMHPAGIDRGGDLNYARTTVTGSATITHRMMPLDERHLPYADITALAATDEPAPSTITLAMFTAQLQLLDNLGSDCHLTGDGGDTLLWTSPSYLADLARSGRLFQLAIHAQSWARLLRVNPWVLLAHAFRPSAPHLPPWLCDQRHPPARGQSTSAELSLPAADYQVLTEIRGVGRTAHADAQIARTYGVNLHNPFCDGQVISAALAVPAWERSSARQYKPLLTAALRQVIPRVLAARTTKGMFEADHHRGLRTHLSHVLALVDGELAARGLIDVAALRHAVSQAAAGLPTHFGFLETTLACEAWLRALPVAPPVMWVTEQPEATE
ncbi:MAG: albusnodin/ikarugamycin family macrolactam cyclase [Pseudonocardia sp.]